MLTEARDINNNGWIVGEAENHITHQKHAFLLSIDSSPPPIPEPETYAMLVAG